MKEDESGYGRKQEVILEEREQSEQGKGEELKQNKGWRWEAGTGRGGSKKDLDGLF